MKYHCNLNSATQLKYLRMAPVAAVMVAAVSSSGFQTREQPRPVQVVVHVLPASKPEGGGGF
jgi:hypothetical protein